MTLLQDVRYGSRVLLKSPGFLVAAVVSLALGIGANATIFTMINTIFLQPLPVETPDELMFVYGTDTNNTSNAVLGQFMPLSYPNYVDYKTQNAAFSELAVYSFPNQVSLGGGGKPEPASVQLVSGNYFSALGVKAAQGRTFLQDEDKAAGTSSVAVLDYKFWQRRFGGNPGIVGDTIRVNGHPFTVIGVAPRGFDGTIGVITPDMWTPVMSYDAILAGRPFPGGAIHKNRRLLIFNVFGRLKPGVSVIQAQSTLQIIGRELEKEFPNENTGRNVAIMPLVQATIPPALRSILLQGSGVLMAIVGLVLLIACANVANLMMARATARRREFTVRLALGGARTRLVRQLLVESLIIAAPGALLAIAVAIGGRKLIVSLLPAAVNPANLNMPIDLTVLSFTLALAVVSAILFGIAPAIRASRADLASDLKERLGGGGAGRYKWRNLLVFVQVTLSVVALASAGLFVRSLANAQTLDLGFEREKLVSVPYNVALNNYDESRGKEYHRQIVDRVRTLPGVAAVSVATTLPLNPPFQRSVFPEGQENIKTNSGVLVYTNVIGTGYFETVRMPLLRGRGFTDADREGQQKVVVINEAMARRFWPDQEALGKRFRFFGDTELSVIIGVVRNAKYIFVGEDPQPMAYTPLEQNYSPGIALIVRTASRPDAMKGVIEREVQALDRDIPLNNIQTASELLSASLTGPRVAATLLGVFGLLALVLAGVGIYGVMSYSVNLRTQEIGIRMALGAQRQDVLKMVLRQGMTVVSIGLAVGLIMAAGISRMISRLLYGVGTADMRAFSATAAVLLFVALVANFVPARRATTVAPNNVMRYE
jgi:putative ABC transport system permease protein